MNQSKTIGCVSNSSEGRDLEKIGRIVAPFHGKFGVKLLDHSDDEDHNRLVVTLAGGPEASHDAVIEAIGIAIRLIDLNHHSGQHPRMGMVNVVPFIPIENTVMEETVTLSKEVASRVVELYNLPVFLYEKFVTASRRENLALIRRGRFEGMTEETRLPKWQLNLGPAECHSTAGTAAIGAQMPLVVYSISLSADNPEIAMKIAKNTRHIDGDFRYVKTVGVELKEWNITQVSINMADYTRTALYRAFELARIGTYRCEMVIAGSEVIGLMPTEVLIDTTSYYLGPEDFPIQQVLEVCIMEQYPEYQSNVCLM